MGTSNTSPSVERPEQTSAALKPFVLDLRGLAAMRIGLGLIILVDIGLRARYLVAHYTDAGILPRSAVRELVDRPLISIHMLSGEPWLPVVLMIVLAGAAIGLLIGYRTRIMTAGCWLLLLSVNTRNPFITDTGDAILVLMLLWGMLLPLGAMWSVDAHATEGDTTGDPEPDSGRPRTLLTPATMGLVLQICLIYLISVLYKTADPWRVDFTAVWYALQVDTLSTPLGNLLADAPMPLLKLLTIATLLLEGIGPLLVLVTAWKGRIRTAAIFAFIGFHLGLASAMYLGIFPFVCIAAWTALLPSSFWDRVSEFRIAGAVRGRLPDLSKLPTRLRRSAHPPTLQPGFVRTSGAILLIVSSGLLAAHNIAPYTLSDTLGPAWVRTTDAIRSVGVYQHWTMFAPKPGTMDSWYSFTGVGIDGTRQNVLFEREWPEFDADDPYARPTLVRTAIPDGKWEKFLFKYYWKDEFAPYRDRVPSYLWARWHRLHPDQPLERIDVERFVEETPAPGDTAQIERQVLMSYRGPDAESRPGVAAESQPEAGPKSQPGADAKPRPALDLTAE